MSQKKKTTTSPFDFVLDLVVAGFSFSASKTIFFPIELTKDRNKYSINGKYYDVVDYWKKLLLEEGVYRLYHQNLGMIKKTVCSSVLKFPFNDAFKRTLNRKKEESSLIWFAANVISGGLAGFVNISLFYSLDQARRKWSTFIQRGEPRPTNLIDLYKHILSTEGIKGLHRGFFPASIGTILFNGIYFGLYESSYSLQVTSDGENNFFKNLGGAYLTTVFAYLVSVPFDNIRRYMIQDKLSLGFIDCVKSFISQRGAIYLYLGVIPNLLIPSLRGGATLFIYYQIQRIIQNDKGMLPLNHIYED